MTKKAYTKKTLIFVSFKRIRMKQRSSKQISYKEAGRTAGRQEGRMEKGSQEGRRREEGKQGEIHQKPKNRL